MLALKGKLTLNQSETVVRVPANAPFADLVTSLASMGYDKRMVEQKIAQLVEEMSVNPDFEKKSQKEKEDILFRRAIVELS